MPITISTKTYKAARTTPDAVTYTGPGNTLSIKDTIELKRVYPKPVTGFAGVARPAYKQVRTVTLADGITKADAIYNQSGSFPVGMTDADIAIMLADAASYLALEIANTTALNKKLEVVY